MNKEIALAQAATLAEWADRWLQDSQIEPTPGSDEIVFLLMRAAKQMRGCVGAPEDPRYEPPKVDADLEQLRTG